MHSFVKTALQFLLLCASAKLIPRVLQTVLLNGTEKNAKTHEY